MIECVGGPRNFEGQLRLERDAQQMTGQDMRRTSSLVAVFKREKALPMFS
jgi:hypothetical protein